MSSFLAEAGIQAFQGILDSRFRGSNVSSRFFRILLKYAVWEDGECIYSGRHNKVVIARSEATRQSN